MTKRKYLRKLRKALGRIPESEKEELIEYYAEIIDESYERGKTTREIFATLESPEQVASDYFNANEGSMDERRRPVRDEFFSRERDDNPERRERKKPNMLLSILLFPLFLVAFVLALSASITIIALLIADVALVIGLSVGGLYCFVVSFGLIPAHGTLAVTQIGAAIALFGVAMLLELTVKPLAIGVGAFFRLLFRRRSSSSGTVAQARWLSVLVAGLIFILIGGGMGGFGFYALGGDWHNLAVVGEMTEKEQVVEIPEDTLSFVSDNLRVNVVSTEEKTAKLVYYESEELKLEYSCENGVVSLKSGEWSRNAGEFFKESWKRGVMFSAVMSDYIRATLYLPASYRGNLSLKVDNGSLALVDFGGEGAPFGSVTLSSDNGMITVNGLNAQTLIANTDNGMIRLDGVIADSVTCETDNGVVELTNITAAKVHGITSNGAIKCERVNGNDITLKTDNGAIKGTIVGQEDDFRIRVSVGNGFCNLKDRDTGDKLLSVNADNGAVKLHFVA